jgi:hypothetical protein
MAGSHSAASLRLQGPRIRTTTLSAMKARRSMQVHYARTASEILEELIPPIRQAKRGFCERSRLRQLT